MYALQTFFISNALPHFISLCTLPDKKIWYKLSINSKLISVNYKNQQRSCFGCGI